MLEITELYKGKIICEFDDVRHRYTIVNKGRRFKPSSVTAICGVANKPALIWWALDLGLDLCREAIKPGTEYAEIYLQAVFEAARKQHQTVKQEAAQKGKERHHGLETLLRAAKQAAQEIVIEGIGPCVPIEVERRVYSRRHRFSGTLDAIVRTGRDLVLLDWKTGKAIYPEYRLQTAAYQHAWEEEFPDQPIADRYLIRTPEENIFEPHPCPPSSYRLDFKGFMGAKALHERLKQIEKSIKKSVIS